MANRMPICDDTIQREPPIGAKPGWICAAERIAELAGAIERYADQGHGMARRFLIRMWAKEIMMQLDVWDEITETEEEMQQGR